MFGRVDLVEVYAANGEKIAEGVPTIAASMMTNAVNAMHNIVAPAREARPTVLRFDDMGRVIDDGDYLQGRVVRPSTLAVRADRAELADRVRALKQPSTIEPLLMDRIEAWNAAIEAAAVAIAPGS